MTNKELQELLKQMPDDAEVFVHPAPDDDFYTPLITKDECGDIVIMGA